MRILELPSAVLLAIFTYTRSFVEATDTPPSRANASGTPTSSNNESLPSTGTGSSYASACFSAQASYSSAYTSYVSAHATIQTSIQTLGGVGFTRVTYYENATTLCDGHPRVASSPAKSLSTGWVTTTAPIAGTTTVLATIFSAYPSPSPTCIISADDCEPLLSSFSSSVSAGRNTTAIPSPPCRGVVASQSLASVDSALFGCGKCTIYGEGVELVYFPTSASRNMCASTPTATLTHYGPSAVITAYAGKSFGAGSGADPQGKETAVVDGHTFTSGTAYISISRVSAVDRCSSTYGSIVSDAILALPSESVLSLRYSQDHFQRLLETDKITGYPVSYADFNTPVPWSAWNGMVTCDPYGFGGLACDVIYDGQFRPQLAIPPQITDLSPDFKGCQMFYNGLWDPPLALQPAESAALATLPGGGEIVSPTSSAQPASTVNSPQVAATALPNQLGSPTSNGNDNALPGPTLPAATPSVYKPAAEPWTHEISINGKTWTATGTNGEVHINQTTLKAGGSAQDIDGYQASYGANGLVIKGSSTIPFDAPDANNSVTPGSSRTITAVVPIVTVVTYGTQTFTALQSVEGGPIVYGSTTLTPGGPATTATNGQVLSAGKYGLVVNFATTVDQADATSNGNSNPDVLTYGGKSITEDSSNAFSIGPSQVLTPNGALTVSGTTMSLDKNGGYVVVNGVTQTLVGSTGTSSGSDQSGASRSSTGGGETSSTAPTATGSAAAMSSSQALSFFVALVAVALLGT
ncbi:Hypothetical predicted protein [Lecanosticta acicola]|uniref:Uncharacterized protein n=1 Tax=Lecanosticta acicola TaxID=111012 RepID=A0AAI8W1G4_9PEZI|nr:Hypothetical predicted protein [Lecanosticta acicola]